MRVKPSKMKFIMNLYRIIIRVSRIGTQQKTIEATFAQEHFPKYWQDL